MHSRELPLVLLILMIRDTSENCVSRLSVTAVEGEPFYLKYCRSSSEPENERNTRWCYQRNESQEQIELDSISSPRVACHDYALEFWPVELDDSGSYFLKMGNDSHKWKLNVIRRNRHSCFTEKQVNTRTVEVKKHLKITCEKPYYQKLINRTSLYKNCKEIEIKGNTFEKNAEFKDQGYYTCVLSLHYNGKQFNVTKTFNVTIAGDNNNIIPALLGPKFNQIEVELGKNVELNCSALLNRDDAVYWNFENESNVHEDPETKYKTLEGKWHGSRRLRIENVNEKNLNLPYNCTVASKGGTDVRVFILMRKDDVDIPGHIFTRGMIIVVCCLVAIVCIITGCVIYRVDLVLLYRQLIGKDETLTDGKTYDAFVSYLKEYRPENHEEHTFAVEILPRVLEKHFGYKLCIFERDIMPGGVVDEIHSLIEKSRRLIIVLSKNYMSSEVRYELESGLHEALVGRKIKIILIEFTSVSDFMVLPQSLELLKSHQILKWKADNSLSYNSRFWKNLRYLMPAKAIKPGKDDSEILPVLSQT